MKKFILLFALILIFSTSNVMEQTIVRVKPQEPSVVIAKPNKTYKNKVWIEGHWNWNKRVRSYQ